MLYKAFFSPSLCVFQACACTWRGCLSQAAITMSLPRGAPHDGGAPLAPFRYIADREDPGGGWLLKEDSPFSLMPGRTLPAYDAEWGINEDVYLACPGTDPPGILGYRGAFQPPHRGVNDAVAGAAATAHTRSGISGCPAGGGGRQLALPAPCIDGHLGGNDGANDRKPPRPYAATPPR